jgi:hypothetical protein
MKNCKAERINASAKFLRNKSKDYGQAMNVYCQDHSRKIMKDISSLNRSLLTATEIDHIIICYLICLQAVGWLSFTICLIERLDCLEKKLNGLKADAIVTPYEIKKNNNGE